MRTIILTLALLSPASALEFNPDDLGAYKALSVVCPGDILDKCLNRLREILRATRTLNQCNATYQDELDKHDWTGYLTCLVADEVLIREKK